MCEYGEHVCVCVNVCFEYYANFTPLSIYPTSSRDLMNNIQLIVLDNFPSNYINDSDPSDFINDYTRFFLSFVRLFGLFKAQNFHKQPK